MAADTTVILETDGSTARTTVAGLREAADTARDRLVTSRAITTEEPQRRAHVPGDAQFKDDDDFLESEALAQIGEALIDHWPELRFLQDAEIAYRWKRKGGKSGGRLTLGKCQKTSGALKHFAGVDFLVWIAADHARTYGLTNFQLEALVYHELKHASFEEDEDENSPTYGTVKFTIRGHDDELFWDELRRYGAWKPELERTGEAYEQIGLAGV